jgi:hypothetical protein
MRVAPITDSSVWESRGERGKMTTNCCVQSDWAQAGLKHCSTVCVNYKYINYWRDSTPGFWAK